MEVDDRPKELVTTTDNITLMKGDIVVQRVNNNKFRTWIEVDGMIVYEFPELDYLLLPTDSLKITGGYFVKKLALQQKKGKASTKIEKLRSWFKK